MTQSSEETDTGRGPLGDARPDAFDAHHQREGPQKPEALEDRPGVGKVRPEDYPEDQRAKTPG
ncbi:hypothetical protein WBP07_21065 (plasmid) [Novosphingobium sp. BL-8A]|uniref:hypothetical protein n=1 Tax=Novosphingobium sp. BL-8A TaxID=3127639 RepID=UPI0037574861